MQIETTHVRPDMTADQMRQWLSAGWGELGASIADAFQDLNGQFFDGALRPLPVVPTPVSPYGNWLGLTCGNPHAQAAHVIYLTVPHAGETLVADRSVLLHEMAHAWLFQRGENSAHDGEPWRREIMRLSALAGRLIDVQPVKFAKVRQPDGKRKSVRVQQGELSQLEIANWPRSIGLDFGPL